MISFVHKLLRPNGNLVAELSGNGGVVLLLSGLSSFASSQLSPVQNGFLDEVTPPDAVFLPSNYPFRQEWVEKGYREPWIVTASLRNIFQFFLALGSVRYGRWIARSLEPYLKDSSRFAVVITGSCGLALMKAAWPFLNEDMQSRILVVSLGPVGSWYEPKERILCIQGKRDWISRFFSNADINHMCDCGHMGYYENREVRQLVRSLCDNYLRREIASSAN